MPWWCWPDGDRQAHPAPGAHTPLVACRRDLLSASPHRTETPPRTRPRPVALLTVWAVLLGLGAALAPVAQSALGVPYELLSLVMLAPALACVVALVRPHWRRTPWQPGPASHVLVSALLAVGVVGVAVVPLALLTGRYPSLPDPSVIGAPLAVLVGLQAVGALGEELGWRGLAQRCGEEFAPPLVVAVLAGLLFGATHLGYWSYGLGTMAVFTLFAAMMSVTAMVLGTGSMAQRMVPAVLVHLGVNLSALAFAGPDSEPPTTPGAMVTSVVILGAALLAVRVVRPGALDALVRQPLRAPSAR